MGKVSLTRTRIVAGRYEGVLAADAKPPVIEALHLERIIGNAEVSPIKGAAGNVEFFVLIGGVASDVPDTVDANAVNAAVTRARALP